MNKKVFKKFTTSLKKKVKSYQIKEKAKILASQ